MRSRESVWPRLTLIPAIWSPPLDSHSQVPSLCSLPQFSPPTFLAVTRITPGVCFFSLSPPSPTHPSHSVIDPRDPCRFLSPASLRSISTLELDSRLLFLRINPPHDPPPPSVLVPPYENPFCLRVSDPAEQSRFRPAIPPPRKSPSVQSPVL